MGYTGDMALNPNISLKGYGQPGWCALCSLDDRFQKPLAKLYTERQSSTRINEWLQNNVEKTFNRRTIYKHREHVKHPRDRLVGAVKVRQQQGLAPQQASDEEFLDAVIAAGQARIAADPGSVTIDQTLKAVGIRQQSRQSKQGGIAILIATLTKPLEGPVGLPLPDGIIDGEAAEVFDS